MSFVKYQKVRRLGDIYTNGILSGEVYVFPKLDGANGSVWFDEDKQKVMCASRRVVLKPEKTNQGFYNYVQKHEDLRRLVNTYPTLRFYGEWLVPHSIKEYKDDAWEKFYIFDVVSPDGYHLPYPKYKKMLEEFDVEVVPPIKKLMNPKEDDIIDLAREVDYLMKDGKTGEGVVAKNYDFVNRYGEQTWAKVVTGEFKKKNYETFGSPKQTVLVEEKIIDNFLTEEFVRKEMSKMGYDLNNYPNEIIGEFLGRTWRTFIEEETFNMIKEFKNPRLNFGFLNKLFIDEVKKYMGLVK